VIILIHTSKTMRLPAARHTGVLSTPLFLAQAQQLRDYLATLSAEEIEKMMQVSQKLAVTTRQLLQDWTIDPSVQRPAIESFLGDTYSGLQVADWTTEDRTYAQSHLRILSGLYGLLRPLDGIFPYRFEMGYKTPGFSAANPYVFWDKTLAAALPDETVIDLSAVEYGKTVTQYMDTARIITPRFLTISPKTGEPTFVVVHAKIARGAYASWMIRHKIEAISQLPTFHEIGYEYSEDLSTPRVPVFICQTFGGLGLSVRLT